MPTTRYQFLLDAITNATPDHCIEWPWRRDKGNYGQLWANGACMRAHRAAYQATNGPIGKDVDILHRCDNPPCFNPLHLFPGTALENVRDCSQKGRRANFKGSANSAARLKESDIPEIRRLRSEGHRLTTIAEQFNVSITAISRIALGKKWTHV